MKETQPSHKPHTIIIGAGLAGLSAAYNLLKTGSHAVTVIESRDRVGGRVHSTTIDGYGVDLGGFIIYPWYTEYHALLDELGIEEQLHPVPKKEIYYEFGKTPKTYLTDKQLELPLREALSLAQKTLIPVLLNRDVASPRLHDFDYQSIRDYIESEGKRSGKDLSRLADFFDLIAQGYCYGSADAWKAAFIAPIVRQTQLYGNVTKAAFFLQGNGVVPKLLAKKITELGGTILLSEQVTTVAQKTITTDQRTITADSIIMAQNATPDIYQQAFPDIPAMKWRYTTFIVAIVDLGTPALVNETEDWNGVFYAVDRQKPYHITSITHLGGVYGELLSGKITVNIQLTESASKTPSTDELLALITDELQDRFPESTKPSILAFEYWKHTMPIADEHFVAAVREAQGDGGIFVAGDYLGAPSMETAIRTGISAAQLVDTYHFDTTAAKRLTEQARAQIQQLRQKIDAIRRGESID